MQFVPGYRKKRLLELSRNSRIDPDNFRFNIRQVAD